MPAARDAATREIDVVEDGNAGEERGNLIGAAQSATDSLVGRKCGHVRAEKAYRSRGWWKVAGDAVEKRRLACAVRSQNAPAFARPHRQGDVDQRRERAEIARHPA